MSGTEERVLMYLATNSGCRASQLGVHLWGRGTRKPQAYCRPAAKILRRLERAGFIRWRGETNCVAWYLTYKGRERAGLMLTLRLGKVPA